MVVGRQKTVLENGEQKSVKRKPIKTFRDLIVYQNVHKAQIIVLTEIIPKLPREEKFDLGDQMRRGCKSAPARLAEAFAKRYQKRQWKKSIDDTIGECYEMINHLSVCMDVYSEYINVHRCKEVIDIYDKTCGQLTKLKQNWQDYHDRYTGK